MTSAEFEPDRVIIARAEHDSDLVQFVTNLAKEKNIEAGTFTAMGALKEARIGFYNQDSHEYQEIEINHPCEIASCVGNISLKDGESFTHIHAVLTDENGKAKGGHLSEGKVFAAEIHLQELEGPKLVREHDDITDLSLWEVR